MSVGGETVQEALLMRRGRQLFLLYRYMCAELTRVLHRQGPEVYLRFLSDTCRLWRFHKHPGLFADGHIENELRSIASGISSASELKCTIPEPTKVECDTILHVLSEVPEFGGHLEALLNWIEIDSARNHLVLATGMTASVIPDWFVNRLATQRAGLVQLPFEASWFERAQTLRQISKRYADLVVLHHHPEDPLPTLAFAVCDVPPVAAFNHADHLFWLGASVVDAILDHRIYGLRISKERRFAQSSYLLPLPLVPKDSAICRTEARRQLGVRDAEVVLLAVAAHYKFVPNERYNFFRTLNRVLEGAPHARLFVVGVQSELLPETAKQYLHERMQLVAPQPDIGMYRCAADIVVESMPYGSSTALLECILAGAAPMVLYAPQPKDIALSVGHLLAASTSTTGSEDEYIRELSALIDSPAVICERAREANAAVIAMHTGADWLRRLESLYQEIVVHQHVVRSIPEGEFHFTEIDREILRMNEVLRAETPVLADWIWLGRRFVSMPLVLRACLMSFRLGDSSFDAFQDYKKWLAALLRAIARFGST